MRTQSLYVHYLHSNQQAGIPLYLSEHPPSWHIHGRDGVLQSANKDTLLVANSASHAMQVFKGVIPGL